MKLSDQIVSRLQSGRNKLSPMIDDFKHWSELLEFVETGVIELCVGREVYKEMLEMYRRNPESRSRVCFTHGCEDCSSPGL
jgi:acid phosphatase class B